MFPAQDTFGYMNTLHIQYTWECRATDRAMHCSHFRTQQYFHTQTGFPTTTSQAGTSYSCLNLAFAQNICPITLPVWHPEVTQECKNLTLISEITNRLLCGLQEERPQGEQILPHPQGQHQGRIPPLPPRPAAHSSTALLIAPSRLLKNEATNFSDPDTYSWNTLYPHKWPKTNLALVPKSLPVAEKKPSWCGMQGVPSPREKKFLTQNYKIMDFKAMEFMHGKPVTGAGLKPAYLAFHMV